MHCGAKTIAEYNNPKLLPGMFPTLWPFSVGGFEEHSQKTNVSFSAQENYYFDPPDHSICHHNAITFVTSNIIQQQASHLQTHFTVQKKISQSTAEKLVSVTSDTLYSTVHHLENEGCYQDLSEEQKKAMDVLKQVNAVGV